MGARQVALLLVASLARHTATALRLGFASGLTTAASDVSSASTNVPQFEVLDADARIFLWHHFLTDAECDYLRTKAERRLERSGVVDSASGASQLSDVRTSDGMFFARAEDAVIEAVERRIAAVTLTPVWHGEGLQVLRYGLNQKYDAHWDWFFDAENVRNGGNRWATVLMYLHDNLEEGGETVFPKVPPRPRNGSASSCKGLTGLSECAQGALAVKPQKGDAILFHSMRFTGELEERSMHGACPVLRGTKWSMTKWIHAGHFRMGGDMYDAEADTAAAHQHDYFASRSNQGTGPGGPEL